MSEHKAQVSTLPLFQSNNTTTTRLSPILELDNEEDYMIDILKNTSSEEEKSVISKGKREKMNVRILIAEDRPLDRAILKHLFYNEY